MATEVFEKGSTVLFYGDSITDWYRDRENPLDLGLGYVARAVGVYRALFGSERVTFYNRGVSGDRVRDLVRRYEEDVKALHPDYLVILIGINDTWRRYDANDATSAEDFEAQYRVLLQNIRRDLPACKIMMVEPFVLHEPTDRLRWHEDLDPKRVVVARLAQKFADYFVPMQGILTETAIREKQPDSVYLADGVHPAAKGQAIIAHEILKAFGVL